MALEFAEVAADVRIVHQVEPYSEIPGHGVLVGNPLVDFPDKAVPPGREVRGRQIMGVNCGDAPR
jgi:hypothetical protein